MIRHPAFPNVPALEPVGPMDGRRFMESLNDLTLTKMAAGHSGEPQHVVQRARQILQVRQIERKEGA